MIAYVIRRVIQAVIVIIVVSILIFLLLRLLPADPLMLFIAKNELEILTEADLNSLRVELGLDKPMVEQYFGWAANLCRGDFGTSIVYHEPVGKLLAERFPVTLHLGILSLILSVVLGILAGVISAVRRRGPLDILVTSAANFGISVPNFWLGILMIYLFGFYLGWLPICGYTSPFDDFWLSTKQLIMPVICLSVVALSSKARQTRSSMLEVIQQDYIRTAWSKGLRERAVIIRHTLKNGLIPVITLIGLQVSHIIGGSVLVETVFNVPGMGRLLVSAVFDQDYQVVQSGCLVVAIVVVLINLVVDISYSWLDPRIRYG